MIEIAATVAGVVLIGRFFRILLNADRNGFAIPNTSEFI